MIKAIIHKEHYSTTISSTTHTLIADEPIADGGTDKGFAPMELLASSLAACTCITLRMYADRKEWGVDSIETNVTIDTKDDTTTFEREILLKGNFSTEQKERLESIANRCPVHKLLTKTITVHTTINDIK